MSLPPCEATTPVADASLPSSRRRLLGLLWAQFTDGFGGRFHGVLLGIYVLRVGGLSGFAGFAAIGTLGGALAPLVAGIVTGRAGGRALMRGAAVSLVVARVGSYAAVLLLDGIWWLFALRLVGAVSGILLVNGAKGQVESDEAVSTSMAWHNVTNAGGQAAASLAAGALSVAPDGVIALVATPVVVAATIPMLRLARFAPTVPVSLRDQLASLPMVARPAILGSVVMGLLAAPLLLADGLTAEQYGVAWLGPLTVMGFVGGLAAASAVPLVERLRLPARHDPLLWSAVGALGLTVWAFSDAGPGWLLAGRVVAGLATGVVASCIEARVFASVPRDRRVPALAASAGVGSLIGTVTALGAGPAVTALGIRTFTLLTMLGLALVGIAASLATRRWPRLAGPQVEAQAA